jgi:squalene-hopene/tetraprenyl-beta-curcumene cyclase
MGNRALTLALWVLAAAAGWPVIAEGDGPDFGDRARVARAIGYLDARQEAWAGFARAGRGEGAHRTNCVSCHTGLGYALARPALGAYAEGPGAGGAPAAAEARTRAASHLRVAHWSELDSPRFELMYDSDDQKKVESRGTEAVLNALVLARGDAALGRAEPSAATRAALGHLWATQTIAGSTSGSWDWLNFGLEPWESPRSRAFGAALAAIAVGAAPGYLANPPDAASARGVRELGDYLRRRFPKENLHNRLWIVLASTAIADPLTDDQKRRVLDQLSALQQADGGWALARLGDYTRVDGTEQATDSDGYATGLALRVLLRHGRPTAATEPALARGLAWVRSHQQADGSWPGRSINKERDPTTFAGKLMTDAATAFCAWVLVDADSPQRPALPKGARP